MLTVYESYWVRALTSPGERWEAAGSWVFWLPQGRNCSAESDGGVGTDAPVHSARWQEDEKFIRGVGGVFYNAVGFVDAANVVRSISDGG